MDQQVTQLVSKIKLDKEKQSTGLTGNFRTEVEQKFKLIFEQNL